MNAPHAIDLTTDWHCHLLPGIDDGPATLEESLAIARHLAQSGVQTVHCTPHFIKGSYEYTPAEIKRAVGRLQEELDRCDIQLELQPGMEYLLDEFFSDQLKEPLPLGNSNLLLVEAYPTLSLEHLKEHIFAIVRAGLQPLLAHPERNALLAPYVAPAGWLARLFTQKPESGPSAAMEELINMGCLMQGNLGSLSGYYGQKVQAVARIFHQHNLYHCFGSDSHSATQCHATLTQDALSKF